MAGRGGGEGSWHAICLPAQPACRRDVVKWALLIVFLSCAAANRPGGGPRAWDGGRAERCPGRCCCGPAAAGSSGDGPGRMNSGLCWLLTCVC
jgi:hypothetical protein